MGRRGRDPGRGRHRLATKSLIVDADVRRLDAFLAKALPGYTRAFLKDLVKRGHVSVDGERRDPDERVSEGQRVEVELPRAQTSLEADFEGWVLFEDKRLLVLHKPAGLLMHPLGTSWLAAPEAARAGTVENLAGLLQTFRPAILKAGTPRCGIVHRLDRLTSGVLVVAKDPETWTALCAAFKERLVDKSYRAIVRGVPQASSRVQAPIGREPGHRRIVVTSLGKAAETAFKVVARKTNAALVEAKPLTGRTHQIRAHLAFLGHPVMGDPEFDKSQGAAAVPPRTMLHAYRLAFEHPASGRPAVFVAEPPQDFVSFWKSL